MSAQARSLLSGPRLPLEISGLDLRGADLTSLVVPKPRFIVRSEFDGADLRQATLDGVSFRKCSFIGADFRGASLRGARFAACDLTRADFRGADLTNARIGHVNTGENRADQSDVTDCVMTEADVSGIEWGRVIGRRPLD